MCGSNSVNIYTYIYVHLVFAYCLLLIIKLSLKSNAEITGFKERILIMYNAYVLYERVFITSFITEVKLFMVNDDILLARSEWQIGGANNRPRQN